MEGFPIINDLNNFRHQTFLNSNEIFSIGKKDFQQKVACWLGHKALSVITLPVNFLGLGIGTAGLGATASTLGVIKVAIFAVTLGQIKPSFSTGCAWFCDRMQASGGAVLMTGAEVAFDGVKLVFDGCEIGYRLIKCVADKLQLSAALAALIQKISNIVGIVFTHIGNGFARAYQTESQIMVENSTPFPFNKIDEETSKNQIDLTFEDRSVGKIIKHTVLSIVNIPVNSVVAGVSWCAALILTGAFLVKAGVNIVTNKSLPVPSFAPQAYGVCGESIAKVVADITTNVADTFISIYKISEATGLVKVVTTAIKVVKYIPEALFG